MKKTINAEKWVEEANQSRNVFNFDPEYSLADDDVTNVDLDENHVIEENDNNEK